MLEEFGVTNKIIDSKVKELDDQDDYLCFVAMVETLNNRLNDGLLDLHNIGMVIIDEAHYNSFRKLFKFLAEGFDGREELGEHGPDAGDEHAKTGDPQHDVPLPAGHQARVAHLVAEVDRRAGHHGQEHRLHHPGGEHQLLGKWNGVVHRKAGDRKGHAEDREPLLAGSFGVVS